MNSPIHSITSLFANAGRSVRGFAYSLVRRFAHSPLLPLFPLLPALALFLPASLATAQFIPYYATDFEAEDGFYPGPLDGRDGWLGEALIDAVTEVASGDQALRIPAGDPPGRVVREFERFADEDVVYVDYFLKGAAGSVPAGVPDDVSDESFLLALVEISEGQGAFHVYDDDAWRRVPAPPVVLDGHSAMIAFVRVTIRLDYLAGMWDFYLDGELVASDLAMPGNGGAARAFTRFVQRGHSERDVVLDRFYAGVGNPLYGPVDEFLDRFRPWESAGEGGIALERHALDRDTSRDGLSDVEALERGIDPNVPGNRFAVSLPFYESFEFRPSGNVDARGGWRVRGAGRADVLSEAAFTGDRGLRFGEERVTAAVEIEAGDPVEDLVWTDLYLRPSLHVRSEPPQLGADTSVGLYFDRHGDAVVWDGAKREWVRFAVPDRDPAAWMREPTPAILSESRTRGDWVRVTVRQDFLLRTWSLWLNSVRVATDLGFAAPVSRYNRFEITEPRRGAHLDDVYIGVDEPSGLDDDGDGVSNVFETLLGIDALRPDTSGDGMWDGDKLFWDFDPLDRDPFLRPVEWGEGRGAGVEGDAGPEGRTEAPGRGPAGAAVLTGGDEIFIGAGGEDSVWIVGRFSGEPGVVPNATEIEGPRTALIAVNPAGFIGGYDGVSRSWRNSGFRIEEGRAVDVAIFLDYETSRWMLCIDGVLRLRDLGFRDPGVRRLTRMAVGDRADSGLIDEVTVLLEEPPGLDFSGDGMTNDEKRALGLDVFKVDTTGDGVPDWWLVEHGIDPLDRGMAGTDLHGFGLTVLEEYLLGTDPNLSDTDGDAWSDFDEYLAGTDALDGESFPDSVGIPDWDLIQVGDTHELEPVVYRVGDEFRIVAAGSAAEGDSDGFAFAYREFTGNFEITAYVHRPENLEHATSTQLGWPAQNGLMARASHDASAPYSAVFSGKFGYYTRFRGLTGRIASDFHHGPVEVGDARYVRLRRTGHRFRHYFSEDGEHWTLASETVILMPETVYAGMFASSHADDFRVRGRVSDINVVQLSDEAEWYDENFVSQPGSISEDRDRLSPFDSFAWMGEWDGTGYHDTAALALRTPSLEEFENVGMEVSLALDLSGADATEFSGEWTAGDDGSMVCLERRGWIEYEIVVDSPDVFLLEVEGREGRESREGISGFELKIYLDDEYLGTSTLVGSTEDPGHIYAFSPWLTPGTHTLRLFWDGASSGPRLRLDSIRLNSIEGPDTSGNGVKDWVEDRLARQSGTDRFHYTNQEPSTTNQEPIFTHVSPLPIEGRARYTSLMRIGREVIPVESPEAFDGDRAFSAHPGGESGMHFDAYATPGGQGSALAAAASGLSPEPHLLPGDPTGWNSYLEGFLDPVSFPAKPGAGFRYHADVPLAPLADNAITIRWQDGVAEERRKVRWVPYDLLDGGHMNLRSGDSMLLTAGIGLEGEGRIRITINGETFDTVPDSPLLYTFENPGEYHVEGTYSDPDGNRYSGTLQVTVNQFTFSDRPLAQMSYRREWQAGEGGPHYPVFEGDPRLNLSPASSGDDGNVVIYGNDNERQTVVARNGESGPIFDSVDVKGFRLFTTRDTYARRIDILPDGTYLVEILLILSPVVEDVRVNVRVIVGGIVFDDGTIEKVLGPEDFDELGQAKIRFIKPKEALTSVCHRIYVYQDEHQLNGWQ